MRAPTATWVPDRVPRESLTPPHIRRACYFAEHGSALPRAVLGPWKGALRWSVRRPQVTAAVPQLWLCRISFRPSQTALFGRASTAPVTELRRKRMWEAPLRSRALTIWPSGIVTRVPAVT